MIDLIGEPLVYFRLRAACRSSMASLPPVLSISIDSLDSIQTANPRLSQPNVDRKFQVSNPLSDYSAVSVFHLSDYHILGFFDRFSTEEIHETLGQEAIYKCLAMACELVLPTVCTTLVKAVDDVTSLTSLLHEEIKANNLGIADILIHHGVKPHRVPGGPSVLDQLTTMKGTWKAFKFTMSKGVSVEEVDLQSMLQFPICCDVDVLRTLLRQHSDRNLVTRSDEVTERAAYDGRVPILKALLEAGAPIDLNPSVVMANGLPMIRYLVQKAGADIDHMVSLGFTALGKACADNSLRSARGILELGASVTGVPGFVALRCALQSTGWARAIALLLEFRIDINITEKESQKTVLHQVLSDPDERNEKKVVALIKHGINVNAQDSCGLTALMLASKNDSTPKIVTALLNAGASLTCTDHKGCDALDHALLSHSYDAAWVLQLWPNKIHGQHD